MKKSSADQGSVAPDVAKDVIVLAVPEKGEKRRAVKKKKKYRK